MLGDGRDRRCFLERRCIEKEGEGEGERVIYSKHIARARSFRWGIVRKKHEREGKPCMKVIKYLNFLIGLRREVFNACWEEARSKNDCEREIKR